MDRLQKLFCLIIVAGLAAQNPPYRHTSDIREEWQDYSLFQKQELLSFCDFLSEEGFHDRALLAYFQFLYRYSGDPLEHTIYYRIANTYEASQNPGLARTYYERVLVEADSGSVEFRATGYRLLKLSLLEEDYEQVLEATVLSEDPYELTFRGYAFFHQLDWTSSRQAFLAAEEKFNHSYYSDLLAPLFQAVDNAARVKPKGHWISFATAFFPGGGHAYLEQWEAASGSLLSTMILYSAMNLVPQFTQKGGLAFTDKQEILLPQSGGVTTKDGSYVSPQNFKIPTDLNIKTNNTKLLVPPLILAVGIYVGSIWKTIHDVDEANLRLVKDFVDRVSAERPVSDFLDFPEPELVIK